MLLIHLFLLAKLKHLNLNFPFPWDSSSTIYLAKSITTSVKFF